MIEKKMNLAIDDIVAHEFKKTKVSGYNKQVVDEYLNLIIEDYENYTDIIEKLHIANKKFLADNKLLNKKITELLATNINTQPDLLNEEVSATTHLTIAQRVSKLEQEVYNLKNIETAVIDSSFAETIINES